MVTYAPDSAGRTTSAIDSGNGINYVTAATYGPDGQMTGFVSGSAITSAFSYNKRLQPVNMSASAPSQTVFSIGYDFHVGNGTTGADNGNVWSIYNYRDRTRDQSFNYDTLNRLISAQNAGTDCTASTVNGKTEYWGNTYGYDPWGNLIDKTITKCGAETFHPGAASVQNQLTGYGYDAAGNMTSDPTDSVSSTYDAENRIATASTPQGLFTYTYDADGNRVEKSGGGTGTLYWYMTPGIIGESDLSGVMKSEYVFFNGERVARRDYPTGSVAYYFSDHLKTASIVTDSAGTIKSESDYYPWGGELQFVNNDSNHYKFTGKERDTESGLDYFGARYYSNGLGRFITPDWAAKATAVPYVNFGDPQTLNLYGYVRNIPTSLVDSDGHEIIYADGLKNAQEVKDTVQAILADPHTSGNLSGYVGPNNPNLTIQSGDLSAGDTKTVNPDGSVTTTTVHGNTSPDIQTTSSSSTDINGITTNSAPETTLNGATITIDNRTSKGDTPGVLVHESVHAGEAKANPAKFSADAKAEKSLPHDQRPQEQRANAAQKAYTKEIKRAVKQIEKDRKKEK